jgi:MFS family permease
LTVAFIAADIGGEESFTWLAMAMSLAFAAVAPTFGALSDLIGRRFLGVMGACLVIAGLAVVGTAQNMPVAIAGMAVTGTGAGICQVIGISGILELVPLRRRGKYMAIVWLVYLPMAPAPGYGWSAEQSILIF